MRPHYRSKLLVSPSRHLSPHQRLELYAQQYWWRLQGAFDEDFPTVQKVISQKTYLKLRDDYLARYPSISFTLRNLGGRFPAYLSNRRRQIKQRELLKDCALFDWAVIEAFDGAAYVALSKVDITRSKFAKKKLFLQPHVQLLSLRYPVDTLLSGRTGRSIEELSNTLHHKKRTAKTYKGRSIVKERVYLAVHRKDERVLVKRLSRATFEVLSQFREGRSLSDLLSRSAAGWQPSARLKPESIGQAFSEASSLGWLSVKKL